MDPADDQDGGQPPVPKRTYGRSRVADEPPPTSMVFAPETSPGKALTDRWKSKSADWRGQLDDIDVAEEQDETEEDLKAARDRLRLGGAAKAAPSPEPQVTREGPPPRALVATSSLTELPSSTPSKEPDMLRASSHSSLPSSTPPKDPNTRPKSQSPTPKAGRPASQTSTGSHAVSPAPSDDVHRKALEPADDSESDEDEAPLRESASPAARVTAKVEEADLSRSLFGEENDNSTMSLPASHNVKPLRKSDEQQLRRDMAAVDRNREAQISRTEAVRRPVSSWMAKATSLINATATKSSPSVAQTSPEDIRQFTPSSASAARAEGFSSGLLRSTAAPVSSSPTPHHKDRLPRPKAVNADVDEDDDEDVDLAGALAVADEKDKMRAKLQALKEAQLKANASRPTVPASDDDDLSIIPETPIVHFGKRSSLLNRQAGPALSKSEKAVLNFTGRPSGKRGITETHFHFAGGQRNHGNLKNVNGGARPAGQKKHHEEAITHRHTELKMLERHMLQADSVRRDKENKFGKSRTLPPKEQTPIPVFIPATESPEGSDDDSDFAPDDDVALDSEMEEEMPTASAGDDRVDDSDGDDDDKENQPVARPVDLNDDDNEGDDEIAVPIRRSRTVRRIVTDSDDEEELESSVRDISLRQAVELPAEIPSASPGLDVSGFGSGSGGFSQLFEDTQLPDDFNEGDGLAVLRNQEPEGLLPSAMMLPSVNMSESQRQRDNALVAAEFEYAERTPVAAKPPKQYLNSEGFFTQTRPANYMTQMPSDPSTFEEEATLQTQRSGASGSSTLVNPQSDSRHLTSPTQGDQPPPLHRLRRRASSTSSSSTISAPPSPVKPNAFEDLMKGARRRARQLEARKHKSALVDEQADESDEDAGWGFPTKGDDDEEEGDDEGYIPELVDDTKINEDDQAQQDRLAAQKRREVEEADDARREAEAKKVTEGHYRIKRKANEFMSDDEDEDGQPRRFTKKQRRQRKLDKADGLFTLGNEANRFLEVYEKDLESDNDFEEAPSSPIGPTSPEVKMSAAERRAMLRERGKRNTMANDAPIEFFGDETEEEESQFSITRSYRPGVAVEEMDEIRPNQLRRTATATRSMDSYKSFVVDESGNQRRAGGGAAGVSVVQRATVTRTTYSTTASSSRSVGRQESMGGSVLFNRTERFR